MCPLPVNIGLKTHRLCAVPSLNASFLTPFRTSNFLASPQLSQDNNNTTTPQHHPRPRTLAPASSEVSHRERVTNVHCERESPLMNEQFFFFFSRPPQSLFNIFAPQKKTRPPSHRKTCRTSSSLASAPRSCIAPARSKSAKAQAPFCSGRAWRGRSSARSSDGFAAEKSGASGRRA